MRLAKTKILGLILFIVFGAVIFSQWHQSPPSAESGGSEIAIPGRQTIESKFLPLQSAKKASVVHFNDEASKQSFLAANHLDPNQLEPVAELNGTFIVNKPSTELVSAGALLGDQQQYVSLLTPNDPLFSQWFNDKISSTAAWDISTGGSGVLVADIDTGFGLGHEDLASRWVAGGRDFVNNDNDPSAGTTNPNGQGVTHGTETAGLVGATANNAKGVASLGWSTKLLPLQVLDDNGQGTTTTVASAIHYAVDQGAKVINMSLGSASPDPFLKAELDYAQSHDVVVVAAAGNCGSPSSYYLNGCSYVGQMVYPANYPQVLAVGATDSNDARAVFSSYGANLDVMAPGAGTIKTSAWSAANPTNLYTTSINGTSFSSPIVAGLAALYRGYKPAATAAETVSAITSSADKVSGMGGQNINDSFGYGRINAAHTLAGTSSTPSSPTTPSNPPDTSPSPLPAPGGSIPHPDGTLVKNLGDSAVYIIIEGTRYHIPDIETFSSWGFSWASVKQATDADKQLPIGSSKLNYRSGSLAKSSVSPNVFALRCSYFDCTKDHIANIDVFNGLELSMGQVINSSQSRIDAMSTGQEITSPSEHLQSELILNRADGRVYLIDNGTKRWIPNTQIFAANNYSWGAVKTGSASDLGLTTGADVGFPEGTLARASNDSAVYVINQSSGGGFEKRHIVSLAVFIDLGYRSSEVNVTDNSYLPSATGADIGN